MLLFAIILPIAAFLLWYALAGRAWLKSKPWAKGFFARVEAIEIALFKKSETILVGRLLWLGSAILTAYDTVAMFGVTDWTPIMTRLVEHVPPDLRGITITIATGVIGLIINWLRKRTSRPLEVVALASKDMTPAVVEAVENAEQAKVEAVAAVKAETA